MSFANQVAVITGASSGIGWALAKLLGAEQCKVGLLARRQERLDELAAEIADVGGTAASVAADVGDRTQTVNAIRELAAKLGPVDLLIANAGVGVPTLLEPMNVPDIEKMFRVNVLGMVYAIEAAMPDMLHRQRGHIVGISSLAALKGLPGESAYCASKAAMKTYLEGLRIQLRSRGIAVTMVCPGFVRTPMTAVNKFHMPWLLEADDAARRIVGAIRRKKKMYLFPYPMALLMKATASMPDWVVERAMRGYNENPPMPPAAS
jgi:short-subunit dehydrogenase